MLINQCKCVTVVIILIKMSVIYGVVAVVIAMTIFIVIAAAAAVIINISLIYGWHQYVLHVTSHKITMDQLILLIYHCYSTLCI